MIEKQITVSYPKLYKIPEFDNVLPIKGKIHTGSVKEFEIRQ